VEITHVFFSLENLADFVFARSCFRLGGSRALNSSKIHHGAALCARIVSALSILHGSGFQSPVKADMFVRIERHLATAPTMRDIASRVMAGGEACGGAGISSTALARETIDVLIFVSVVDLLLSALRFHVNRRGLLQVDDVTDHNQIGEEQESDDDVLHSPSMARKRSRRLLVERGGRAQFPAIGA
jgi:hypothetical protein